MTELIISKDNDGKLIWEYIISLFPEKTKTSIKKNINSGNVKVNNTKIKDNYVLKINDKVKIYFNTKKINNNFEKCNITCSIFYEDENIIIFNKPKGLLCQEDKNEKNNTLNNFIKKYAFSKGYNVFECNNFSLIHRLDKNTQGLIIGSKKTENTRTLNTETKSKGIIKKYLTIVHGIPEKEEMEFNDYILKDQKLNMMKVFDKYVNHSKQIKTKIRLIRKLNNMSILEVEIHSGKKHQIRSHLAFHNLPIVGDYKYAGKKYQSKIKSQILISNEIIFNIKNESLSYLNNMKFKLYQTNNDDEIKKFLQDFKIL